MPFNRRAEPPTHALGSRISDAIVAMRPHTHESTRLSVPVMAARLRVCVCVCAVCAHGSYTGAGKFTFEASRYMQYAFASLAP